MAADQERADRIRALKLERPDLTWRRIADYVGVSERAASDWQKKGGIEYANAEKLARLFEVDVDYIWRGTETSTPDLFAGGADGTIEARLAELSDQIARDREERDGNISDMKALIAEQSRALREQATVLGELRDTVRELRDTVATQQAAAHRLEEMTQAAVDAMPRPAAGRAPRKARTGTQTSS